MYLAKSPFWFQYLYPTLTWHKSRKEKCIYLTFDDGPIPIVTPFVLQTLEYFKVKATFFCVGNNITKYPDIYRQVKNAGHRLGNHTYNHLNGWEVSDEAYLKNIEQCTRLVLSNLFRPPYGKIKKSQITKLNLLNPGVKTIMWDVLSGDFDPNISPEQCLQNVIKHTENGSIIVFHDSLKAFDRLVYALPKILERFVEKGYLFGTL